MKKMVIVLLATTMMYASFGCTRKVPQNTAATLPYTENSTSEYSIHNETLQNIDTYTANTLDLERFFFVPFETGNIQFSTSKFGYYGNSEVYIGIFATTTTENFSGIQTLCRDLSDADPNFAGELTHFSLWSNSQVIEDIKSPESEICSVFQKLDQKDHEKFLNLQLSVMEAKFQKILIEQNVDWLLDGSHSAALIGSYYSLLNWIPYAGWENSISPEKSDKENLISLYIQAFEKAKDSPNIIPLENRFEKQMILALDILYNEKSYTEILNWMINPT